MPPFSAKIKKWGAYVENIPIRTESEKRGVLVESTPIEGEDPNNALRNSKIPFLGRIIRKWGLLVFRVKIRKMGLFRLKILPFRAEIPKNAGI